jgi:hypothetical protein
MMPISANFILQPQGGKQATLKHHQVIAIQWVNSWGQPLALGVEFLLTVKNDQPPTSA